MLYKLSEETVFPPIFRSEEATIVGNLLHGYVIPLITMETSVIDITEFERLSNWI